MVTASCAVPAGLPSSTAPSRLRSVRSSSHRPQVRCSQCSGQKATDRANIFPTLHQRSPSITAPAGARFGAPASCRTHHEGQGKRCGDGQRPPAEPVRVLPPSATISAPFVRHAIVRRRSCRCRQRVTPAERRAARDATARGSTACTGRATPCVLRAVPQVGAASAGQHLLCVPMAAAPKQMCHSTVSRIIFFLPAFFFLRRARTLVHK
jgi:hypothetical protein